jgi:uroporphyrinogen-III synthase
MGADVEKATVYKTVDVDPGEIEFDFIDQILFTSGSTVRAFVRKFSKVPEHIKCYGLGPPTVAEAQKNGIDAEVLPSSNK